MPRSPQSALLALALVALLALLAAPTAPAAAELVEGAGGVPALAAFHDVIYPLWHSAWPSKDLAQMKELLPSVREHVAAVQAAKLPAMLHEKQAKWDAGVLALADAAAAMESALAAGQTQPALDAVEKLHADYEGLVRLLRPASAELDAYHAVLYRLYHHDWPAKAADRIAEDARQLADRCVALQGAAVPKRFASQEAPIRQAFAALCEATRELEAVAERQDAKALDAAIEKVHTRYESTSKLFE